MSTSKNPNKLKKRKMSSTQKQLVSISGKELSLNNLLQAIRLSEAMTQVEFAKLLGIAKQYLCDLEHDRRFVSPKMAESFAIKLEYSPQQFVKLCLQDLIKREGINFRIDIRAA